MSKIIYLLLICTVVLTSAVKARNINDGVGVQTGLPLPRFASLKSDKVNVRTGPGKSYPIDWVFTRAKMPVEIIAEFENWRKIRDWEGVEGWVHSSLIKGTRSVIFIQNGFEIRDDLSFDSDPVAVVNPSVAGLLRKCQQGWCLVEVQNPNKGDKHKGWVHHSYVWGVNKEEAFR
jgi:SH3-like domain-containing protein